MSVKEDDQLRVAYQQVSMRIEVSYMSRRSNPARTKRLKSISHLRKVTSRRFFENLRQRLYNQRPDCLYHLERRGRVIKEIGKVLEMTVTAAWAIDLEAVSPLPIGQLMRCMLFQTWCRCAFCIFVVQYMGMVEIKGMF